MSNRLLVGYAAQPDEIQVLIGADLGEGFSRKEMRGSGPDGAVYHQRYIFYGDFEGPDTYMKDLFAETFAQHPELDELRFENNDDKDVVARRGVNATTTVEYGQ